MMQLAPSPRDTLVRDGTAKLYRFRAREGAGPAVLLVPSLINRWYVLDLRPGASVVEALVGAGLDVFCLDWGEPNDEDRYLEWDDVVARLQRTVRAVKRAARADSIGLLGYCIGGTLAAISTALEPRGIAALVNLAGPIDFEQAGFLGHMTKPRWFDPEAIASAGNMSALQMQAGFMALRPTSQIAKWVSLADKLGQPEKLLAHQALEQWASDNIAFPAAAYQRYIRDLYQNNELVRGEHRIAGRSVDLGAIRCPVLTVTTTRDAICPPKAALALNALAGSDDRSEISIPGGHVGGVVGDRAKTLLYPQLAEFFKRTVSPS
jgi:polyhydroxyalkanoate synthase subunit PhaC